MDPAIPLFLALLVSPPEPDPEPWTKARLRFPDQAAAKEACDFNRDFREHAARQLREAAIRCNPAAREYWLDAVRENFASTLGLKIGPHRPSSAGSYPEIRT